MNILFYSPEMAGHPQVYCRVLADICAGAAGHSVVIAGAGDTEEWPRKWSDLIPLLGNPRVQFVNTQNRSATGSPELTAEELKRLQEDFQIDSTLLLDGNSWAQELYRIAEKQAPRLRGRTVGIFARTSGWFPREDDYGGAPERLFSGSARTSLGRLKNVIWPGHNTQAYFFREILIRRHAVDAVVVKDERVSDHFGPPVFWMPEIFEVFGAGKTDQRMGDGETLAGPIQEYIQRAGASNVLLYFGTGAWYKGYDLFLRLAEIEPSIFALHAGAPERHEPSKPMKYDTGAIRSRLLEQGRLFETNAYIESEELVHRLFSGIERFVSTHRFTLSSGTALQALSAGKPVLTPSGGLVGYRTRRYNLGMTYRYFDDQDLAAKWKEFSRIPPEAFKDSIDMFMKRFSRDEVARFFLSQLCGA